MTKKVPKRAPSPANNKVLDERQKIDPKNEKPPQKPEVLHEKLKTVLPIRILKKKISTPNFTKFLNP